LEDWAGCLVLSFGWLLAWSLTIILLSASYDHHGTYQDVYSAIYTYIIAFQKSVGVVGISS
jgi:hypothetical protein